MFQVDRNSCRQQESSCSSDNYFQENFEVLQEVLLIDPGGLYKQTTVIFCQFQIGTTNCNVIQINSSVEFYYIKRG